MKNKLVGICLLLFVSLNSYSQEVVNVVETEVKELFKNCDPLTLQNILPYKIGNKIGYVNTTTLKIVVKPTTKLTQASPFRPDMLDGIYIKKDVEYFLNIYSKGFSFQVFSSDDAPPPQQAPQESPEKKVELISSKNGYKGFSVDAYGNLQSSSDLYYKEMFQGFDVYPFMYQGSYYAIVNKKLDDGKYYYGIIDTEGNAVKNFDFTYNNIRINNYAALNDNDI